MVDFIKKPIFVYVVFVIVLTAAGIITVKNRLVHRGVSGNSSDKVTQITTAVPDIKDVGIDNDALPPETQGGVTSSAQEKADYMNFFTSDPRTNTSNIVGYIAGGAFVINLVDWIPQKWSMKNDPDGEKGSILFTPKAILPNRDFSDITIRISTTSEENNATYLAEKEMNSPVEKDTIRTSDTIKSDDGNMDIQFVEKLLGSSCEVKFFFDGNNSKTAAASFSATSPDCRKYSARVKEFIKGFSNGVPRG